MRNGECTIYFRNSCPSDWQVSIIEIGAKFFYQNENGQIVREWQTQANVNIESGGEEALRSDDDAACVQQVFVALKAYRPGDGEQVFTGRRVVEPNRCLRQTRFILGPRQSSLSTAKSIEEALSAIEMEITADEASFQAE